MEALLTVQNGTAVLDPAAINKISDFERAIKDLKQKEEQLKQAILEEMEANGVIKIDSEQMLISYIAPTDRETFDTKTFRQNEPALYDSYVKLTPVKASIRIKLK